MKSSPVSAPYCKREFRRLDRWELAGHRLKVYGISVPGRADRLAELLGAARGYAERSLPLAAKDAGSSSGLGYAILHVGDPGTWLLVHWWAHQNIVCQRLALASHDAADFQSMDDRPFHACVWEQVVIQRERDSWVRHMMSKEPDTDRYLEDWLPDGSH